MARNKSILYLVYGLISLTVIVWLHIKNGNIVDENLEENLFSRAQLEDVDTIELKEAPRRDTEDIKLSGDQEQLQEYQSKRSNANKITHSNGQHLRDYLSSPVRLSTFDFDTCQMSNCFDYSRCVSTSPMKVNIVPSISDSQLNSNATQLGESNIIHRHILRTIRESIHYEPDPDKACLFVSEEDTLDRDPLSSSFRQDISNLFNADNNYGMNHLIFNIYSGTWPSYKENDFAGLQFNAAILAKASNSISHHRPGFDISLPLFSYQHPHNDSSQQIKELDRSLEDKSKNYFLTFKGKRYLVGSGSCTRNNLYHLNNQRDVILLTTCRHGKKWREISDERCLDDEQLYDQYDFNDLMRDSVFCLVPRGRRLGSFRFLESLSYACIPIVLSDGWIQPFDEIINWSEASIQFAENDLLQVPDMLRDIDKETIVRMREKCGLLYKKYFSTIEKIILTTLSIIEKRIKNHVRQQSS